MSEMQLSTELKDITPFYAWDTFEVKDEGTLVQAGEQLKIIKERLKVLEAKRKEVTGPIKQGIAKFEEMVRGVTKPLEAIDASLRRKVEAFMDQRQRALEDEAKKKREENLAEEKKKAQIAMNTAMMFGSQGATDEAIQRNINVERLENKPIEVKQTVRASTFTMPQTKYWDWALIDIKKVPIEYFILDEKRLSEIARQYDKNKIDIPGIEFTQKSRVQIR